MPDIQFVRHVRLIWQGRQIDVVTSAADLIDIPLQNPTFGDNLRTYHRACLRLKVEGIPPRLDMFLDGLESASEDELGAGNGAVSDMDPTRPTVSDG